MPTCGCRVGRSQGVRMGGTLAPATEGAYFAAAMQQQWSQIAELQATLDTMTGVVQLQAAQLARMQEHVEPQEQAADADSADDVEQRLPAAGSPSAGRGVSPLAATRPRTAGGTSQPSSASPSKFEASGRMSALRSPSPAGSLTDRRPTSSHHGMIASMKSDLEAWRAK
jgi:Tfp pilus assembly protein FimV